MRYFIDDVATTLAKPMPRRKAFARIAALVGGAFLVSVAPVKALKTACQGNCDASGGNACAAGLTCLSCGGSSNPKCCPTGSVCCGTTSQCCPPSLCVNNACSGTCTGNNNCGCA